MELHFVNERPAPDVLSQPVVQLHDWRLLQRGNGTLHIAAQLDSGSLRVTSSLQAIDLPGAVVKTESGRVSPVQPTRGRPTAEVAHGAECSPRLGPGLGRCE